MLGRTRLDVFVVVERDDHAEGSEPVLELRWIVLGRIVELVGRLELVVLVFLELLERLRQAGRRDQRVLPSGRRLRQLVLRLQGRERQHHARELAQLQGRLVHGREDELPERVLGVREDLDRDCRRRPRSEVTAHLPAHTGKLFPTPV